MRSLLECEMKVSSSASHLEKRLKSGDTPQACLEPNMEVAHRQRACQPEPTTFSISRSGPGSKKQVRFPHQHRCEKHQWVSAPWLLRRFIYCLSLPQSQFHSWFASLPAFGLALLQQILTLLTRDNSVSFIIQKYCGYRCVRGSIYLSFGKTSIGKFRI